MGKHSSHSLLPLFPGAVRFAKGRWWALCFAHDDERKSLLLSKNDHGWRYHCYVCGADGDALDVLMKRDEMTYREALKALDAEEPTASRLYRDQFRWLAICDSCGLEEVRVRDVNHLVELCDKGNDDSWEIAPDGIAAIGPVCLRNAAAAKSRWTYTEFQREVDRISAERCRDYARANTTRRGPET